MIQLTSNMRILVATAPVDMRKRLSVGRFPHWPVGAALTPLEAHEVMVLLRGGDPSAIATLGPWRKIA